MSTEKSNAKNSKLMLISSSLVLVLLVIVFVFRMSSPSEAPKSEYITNQLNKQISIDYNVKNSLTSNLTAATDEYIFYSNFNGLYRINKDGSNKVELDSGEITNLNIYNNNLYYSKRNAEDRIIRNENYTHNIIKMAYDGSDKTEISNVSCQRVGSMLVVNDIILHKMIVFEGDGGKNSLGEPTGKLIGKNKAVSIDGKHTGDVPDEQFDRIMTLNYPYNQSDLDSYLRDEYPNVAVKSSKYSVEDTMYFEVRSIREPKYSALFSISKKDNKLNLITKYDKVTAENYVSEKSVEGFCYSDNNLYYILSERKRVEGSDTLKEKLDLCKLDLSNNTPVVIDTIFKSEDF